MRETCLRTVADFWVSVLRNQAGVCRQAMSTTQVLQQMLVVHWRDRDFDSA